MLTPVGASFKCEPRRDFLRANDGWFRPVSTQTGPDGNLWVMDWCDKYPCYQNAKANPEGVDRARGRIWRVVYPGATTAQAHAPRPNGEKEAPTPANTVASVTDTVASVTDTVASVTDTVASVTDTVASATDTVASATDTVASVADTVASVTDTVASVTDTVASTTDTVASGTPNGRFVAARKAPAPQQGHSRPDKDMDLA